MRLYKLDRIVLSIKNNAAQFLNGLTSNTLDKPRNAFLDVHGKIIATFDQIQTGEDEFLIVLERASRETVLNHIEKFVRLSRVQVQEENHKVYFDLDGKHPVEPGEWGIPQKEGQIILTPQGLSGREPVTEVSLEEFTLFRLKNHIPLLGVDYGHTFLLNVSEDECVSFTKGCFLGQEPVAKVHNRSKPSWKLTVKFEDECPEEERKAMTSKVMDPENRRVLGFVMLSNR